MGLDNIIPSIVGWQTNQTPQFWEDSLIRHAQPVRWMKAYTCPCVLPELRSPDPACPVCLGKGRIYRPPTQIHIEQEQAFHDNVSTIFPRFTPVIAGTPVVWRETGANPQIPLQPNQLLNQQVPLVTPQPADGNSVVMNAVYERFRRLYIDYDYDTQIYITGENSMVVDSAASLLQTIATSSRVQGKLIAGSISAVTRVYDATQNLTFSVTNFARDFIYLASMAGYQPGDVLQVDYAYVPPFQFVLSGISPKMRYGSAYILDEADALLVTSYSITPSPLDLFTMSAGSMIGNAIVNPNAFSGSVDTLALYYDVEKILQIVDASGNFYTPATSVQLYGRNQIKWLVTKPTVNYSVQLLYHPTFSALVNYSTIRTAEGKSFVRRTNLRLYEPASEAGGLQF